MKQEGHIESIRQRLLNLSRARGETFDYILARYGIERVLYRIGKSEAADHFVLKGATLFLVWNKQLHRPTRDLDLLSFGTEDMEELRAMVLAVLRVSCPEDGLTFDDDSLVVSEIREAASYGGARVKFRAMLGNVRIPVQMDVGYGDAITPSPEEHDYPRLLDEMPGMKLKTYPTSTVIAEKFEALVRLDAQNTRMKDYFDLDFLLAESEFDPDSINAAIRATFNRRGSTIPTEIPTGLSEEFASTRSGMWEAFLGKNGLKADTLHVVVSRICNRLKSVWGG